MNRKRIFRFTTLGEKICEYRFLNGICLGFFEDNKERHQEQKYKGRKLTDVWKKNLQMSGFLEVKK